MKNHLTTRTKPGVNQFAVLPDELLVLIAELCGFKDCYQFRMTCRRFRACGNCPKLFSPNLLATVDIPLHYMLSVRLIENRRLAIRQITVGHRTTLPQCRHLSCRTIAHQTNTAHDDLFEPNYISVLHELTKKCPALTSMIASACLFEKIIYMDICSNVWPKITHLKLSCECKRPISQWLLLKFVNLKTLKFTNFCGLVFKNWQVSESMGLRSLKFLEVSISERDLQSDNLPVFISGCLNLKRIVIKLKAFEHEISWESMRMFVSPSLEILEIQTITTDQDIPTSNTITFTKPYVELQRHDVEQGPCVTVRGYRFKHGPGRVGMMVELAQLDYIITSYTHPYCDKSRCLLTDNFDGTEISSMALQWASKQNYALVETELDEDSADDNATDGLMRRRAPKRCCDCCNLL